MLGDLSRVEKIYIRTGYTDMRKQLDGLIDIIQYSFRLDPYSNSLFLFCGKRADRIKAVHYEGDGFCLFYKRYENGRLKWPRTGEEARQISHQQLRWLLEGLNPEQPRAVRKWTAAFWLAENSAAPTSGYHHWLLCMMGQGQQQQ